VNVAPLISGCICVRLSLVASACTRRSRVLPLYLVLFIFATVTFPIFHRLKLARRQTAHFGLAYAMMSFQAWLLHLFHSLRMEPGEARLIVTLEVLN